MTASAPARSKLAVDELESRMRAEGLLDEEAQA